MYMRSVTRDLIPAGTVITGAHMYIRTSTVIDLKASDNSFGESAGHSCWSAAFRNAVNEAVAKVWIDKRIAG